MTNPSYSAEKRRLFAVARNVADLCRKVQLSIDTTAAMNKDDASPVTVADYASQALLAAALGEEDPEDAIVGEEDADRLRIPQGRAALEKILTLVQAVRPTADEADVLEWIDRGASRSFADRYWALDPIDGTKGFLRGDQYAVCLALVVEGEVEFAMLACPNLRPAGGWGPPGETPGSLVHAQRGQGAWLESLDDEAGAAPSRIRVSSRQSFTGARYCESVDPAHSDQPRVAHLAASLGITEGPVRLDSQAKYAAVARGEVDVHIRVPYQKRREAVWDHAAGTLLIQEAGGMVTDLKGRPLNYRCAPRLTENWGIVASNGHLHRAVCKRFADLED